MPDEIKTLSSQLAQDPDSLVFLRLGELLRQKGHLDTAHRVAVTGLERHPHLPDAHDLFARILADKHDYERAFDEWDMALRIAPDHIGALKGLAFLYFKVGDVQQAAAHLEAAQRAAPNDPGVAQALAMARGGGTGEMGAAAAGVRGKEALTESEPIAPAAQPLEEARVFAGLEGAQEGLLLLDASGRVLGGALKDPSGGDVTDAVAAYLAGVSQEAARTVKLLGLGKWTGLAAEGHLGHVHLAPPTGDALLLVVRDRAVPMGPLAGVARVTAASAGYGKALDLITRVRGVRGAMLVSAEDGIVVAEQLMEGIKGPAVSALAASLATRLRRAMEAAGVGASLFWHLQAEQGALLVVPTPGGTLVVAVAEPDVNVGLVRLELLRAAEVVG
jgi:predicted regulator of Ras-like GTPase activity (Roadblock/LC7/MglB family)